MIGELIEPLPFACYSIFSALNLIYYIMITPSDIEGGLMSGFHYQSLIWVR